MRSDSRFRVFTDQQWEVIEPLLPSNEGRRGHPFGDSRRVVEGIAYRYRTGIRWHDLPRDEFGPWQTVWKRHRRYAGDGTWDRVIARILADADAAGKIDWTTRARYRPFPRRADHEIHQAVDGRGRPLAMILTGGQRNEGAMLAQVLAERHVPRLGQDDRGPVPTRSSLTGLTHPA